MPSDLKISLLAEVSLTFVTASLFFLVFNVRAAQDIFWSLYENGFVSTESVEQLYCERCPRYVMYADRLFLLYHLFNIPTVDVVLLAQIL